MLFDPCKLDAPFEGLPRGHFAVVLVDAPWTFKTWSEAGKGRSAEQHYDTMSLAELKRLDVGSLAAPDCVLFQWATWPLLPQALELISAWGFVYKTCAFDWTKADVSQIDLFRDDADGRMGNGYWTRSNTEPCLLATRGKPKRLHADVRQAIIEPRRQHSRKPNCVYGRIERLVAGPYLELFARQQWPGWSSWGNETDRFGAPYDASADTWRSVAEGYRAIRERMKAGGPGWPRSKQS